MDYYYDDYNMLPEYDGNDMDYDTDQLMEEDFPPWSLDSTIKDCVIPSATQILSYIVALIVWCLITRFTWYFNKRHHAPNIMHLVSIISGFGALYFTVGHHFLIVLFLGIVAYGLMLIGQYFNWRAYGFKLAIFTILSHFAYECLWNMPVAWQRIRGVQMVATMKIISLALDIGNEQKGKENVSHVPKLLPYLGYIFNPATCVLGPWISYSMYMRSIRWIHKGFIWMLWTLINAILAITFLSLSNCFVPLICSDSAWKWFRTYRDALSVRCSHYFICFLSQATLAAAGIIPDMNGKPNAVLGYTVTKPWQIEFPRSLKSLVRSWNLPMHTWLKTYVFRAVHKQFSSYLVAILCTYIVSCLLHGVHLRIYIVLFSLGLFAYVENILRSKLASVFNACIAANDCQKPCKYLHCSSHGWSYNTIIVYAVNIGFSFLTIVHLAYLGIMMNTSNAEDDNGSITDGLWKWSEMNFFSHWFSLLNLIFYYFI